MYTYTVILSIFHFTLVTNDFADCMLHQRHNGAFLFIYFFFRNLMNLTLMIKNG